jgi:hypothetical protein
MMGAASMDLKSWGSSDPSLEAKAVAKGVADSNAVSKVLAFRWDRKEDSLRLPPLVLASFYKDGATKRDVLRGIATVYDPMGWYSPLTTPAKLIIQELWWRNLGWDDPIPSDLFEWWISVATALENVQMTLPRSYLGPAQQCTMFMSLLIPVNGRTVRGLVQSTTDPLLSSCRRPK